MLGSSFGAAVAVYCGGVDKRVAAVVSASGWGHGERKFQKQHPTPEGYAKFTAMLAEGKAHRARTGEPLMVPRYDIVPIPEHLRTHVLPGSIQMFEADTAQSMFDFQANNVIGKIAPRPVLLLHSSDDHVTPVEQSIELFEHANQPAEMHLFADTDHFMFAEGNTRVHHVVQNWLANYFPVEREAGGGVDALTPTVAKSSVLSVPPQVRGLSDNAALDRVPLLFLCPPNRLESECPPFLPSRTPRSKRSRTG